MRPSKPLQTTAEFSRLRAGTLCLEAGHCLPELQGRLHRGLQPDEAQSEGRGRRNRNPWRQHRQHSPAAPRFGLQGLYKASAQLHGSHWHSGNGVSASTPCASGTDLDETGGVSARMSRNSFASLACAAHVARRSAHLHLQPGSSCKCKDLAPSRIPGTIFSCSAFSLGWKKGSGPGALAKCWKTSTVSPPDSPAQKTHTKHPKIEHLVPFCTGPLEDSQAWALGSRQKRKRHGRPQVAYARTRARRRCVCQVRRRWLRQHGHQPKQNARVENNFKDWLS